MKKKNIEGQGLILVDRSDYTIIGGKRYLKSDSERIVLVRNFSTNKRRYYRKSSPLLVSTREGYFLKKDCVYAQDLSRIVCSHVKAVEEVDGKYYLSTSVVTVDGKRFYKKDERIVYDYINQNYIYKSLSVPLHEGLYGNNTFTIKEDMNARPLVVVEGTSSWARESDTVRYKQGSGKLVFLAFNSLRRPRNCFVGFVNPENKVFDSNNIKNGVCIQEDIDNGLFVFHDQTDRYVHRSEYDEYVETYNEWYKLTQSANLLKAISYANKRFSDSDKEENKPSFMNFDKRGRKPAHGGELGKDYRPSPIVSSTTVGVGGIGYTFGVEIETSNGYLSDSELKEAGLCVTGDNSINGNEYITAVMHGDIGLQYLENAFKVVKDRCVVDDTCSIHVHVGGLKNKKVTSPDFNIKFAVNAIQLGCQVEESLFLTQPKSRSPYKKHCHSITVSGRDYSNDYRKINMENYKHYLGDYVFGATIGEDVTRMSTPSRWGRTRYKWLNLRNAVSNTDIKTIEFRIFSPTTVYWKALQAIRISLAFTWFVENRKTMIGEGGLTIHKVLEEAYEHKQEVYKDVMKYVETRTEKFKRDLYGTR